MPKLAKRALFELVGYEPHPGQILVHRCNAKFRVLACGVRWGKSTCAAMEALAALMEPRDSTIGWVVGPTYELSKRVFLRTVELVKCNFDHHIESLELRDHRLVIRNLAGGRSELRGKSADNPDSLLGEGLDFLVVDEAARIDDVVWNEHLSQRLIDKNGWAVVLSTPAGKKGWFYRMHQRGKKRRDADIESWSSPSWANPALRQSLIEAERARLQPDVFASQYEAQFCGPGVDPCDRCGGPLPNGPRFVVCLDRKLARCTECNDLVDERGRSVVGLDRMGNRARMMIINVEPPPQLALDQPMQSTALVENRVSGSAEPTC